jgi:hypothetical protein
LSRTIPEPKNGSAHLERLELFGTIEIKARRSAVVVLADDWVFPVRWRYYTASPMPNTGVCNA